MSVYLDDGDVRLYHGDALTVLAALPTASVHCAVTSPPYWGLRDYGVDGQLGLEQTPEEYVAAMVAVFRELRRVLRPDGTLWLNVGDSYAGASLGAADGAARSGEYVGDGGKAPPNVRNRNGVGAVVGTKPKDLIGIPWRLALGLQADGWWLRSDIIWAKPNPMPESVTDRPTSAHEHVFLLAPSARYYFDQDAVREPAIHAGKHVRTNGNDGMDAGYDGHRTRDGLRRGVVVAEARNLRNVWSIATEPTPEAHFATFPQALVERCLKAGCPEGGTVLDPFVGSGTTALVARRMGRRAVGIDLSSEYLAIAAKRLRQLSLFAGTA